MGAIGRHITRNYLNKHSAEHLKKHPQVAVFSFDLITTYISLDGRYELEELDCLVEKVFPHIDLGSTCLDIGGNIGNHALFFADHFKNVIAFEPNPRTFTLLKYNASLVDNILPLNLGGSNVASTLSVSYNPENVAMTRVSDKIDTATAAKTKKSVELKLVKLDDLEEVRSCDKIDFVKIDVEGHEAECLEGAAKTLKKHQPLIAIEVLAETINNGQSSALKVLDGLGYTHYYEMQSDIPFSNLPRPLFKIINFTLSLLTNKRRAGPLKFVEIDTLQDRNYSLVLCSVGAHPQS